MTCCVALRGCLGVVQGRSVFLLSRSHHPGNPSTHGSKTKWVSRHIPQSWATPCSVCPMRNDTGHQRYRANEGPGPISGTPSLRQETRHRSYSLQCSISSSQLETYCTDYTGINCKRLRPVFSGLFPNLSS